MPGPTKPVVFINNVAQVGDDKLALQVTHSGIPVTIGLDAGLAAIKGEMARRDFRARPPMKPSPAPKGMRDKWRARLLQGAALDESESLTLLSDYGVPVLPHCIVESADAAEKAAGELGYPVVLKTAMPGILHKSDVGGVKLNLADAPSPCAPPMPDVRPGAWVRGFCWRPWRPRASELQLLGAKLDPCNSGPW